MKRKNIIGKMALYVLEAIVGLGLIVLGIWLGVMYFQKALPFEIAISQWEVAVNVTWAYIGWFLSPLVAFMGCAVVKNAIF